MPGSKINDYSIGDSNIQSVMLTLDKALKGFHQVSLTNYNTTDESAIAAGSVVEVNGALYKFDSDESITGSPSDGTVYIYLVPSGDTITAAYTNTAPTWSDSKQGWYGTGGNANYRYLEFIIYLLSSSYIYKDVFKPLYKKDMANFNPCEYPFLLKYETSFSRTASISIPNNSKQLVQFDSIIKDVCDKYNETTHYYKAKINGTHVLSGTISGTGFTSLDGGALFYKIDSGDYVSLAICSPTATFSISLNLFEAQTLYFYVASTWPEPGTTGVITSVVMNISVS